MPDGIQQAAVLIAVDISDPRLSVLFVQRSELVSTHQGQIAFPGGRLEQGETVLDAALREASEEVALNPARIEIVGVLPPLLTAVSNRWLTPVVGTCQGKWEVKSDGFEVAEWFWVSLADLMEAPHRIRDFERDGQTLPVHFYDVEGRTIWGVTGAIVAELLGRLGAQLGSA